MRGINIPAAEFVAAGRGARRCKIRQSSERLAHLLEKLPTILTLKQRGYSVLRIARRLPVNRKGVDRVLKLRAEGQVPSRAEARAEVPIEKRGKKDVAPRQGRVGVGKPGCSAGVDD